MLPSSSNWGGAARTPAILPDPLSTFQRR